MTCEVCETVQPPATVCANCGCALRLPPGLTPTADLPIETVPGLEPTSLDPAVGVDNERLPDIEETLMSPAPEVAAEFVPGFESTEDLVLDLPGPEDDETLPGLERTTEEFEKTAPAAGPTRCQYCGFVQATGRICNNCGLALSKIAPPARGRADAEVGTVRCPGCGATVAQAALCSDCGTPLPNVET